MADVEQIGLVRKPKKAKEESEIVGSVAQGAASGGPVGKAGEGIFNGARNCFLIRTHDGKNHILRAKRNEDLDRWLFVLVRMWKVAMDAKLKGPAKQEDCDPQQASFDPFDRYKRHVSFVPPPQQLPPSQHQPPIPPKTPPPTASQTPQAPPTTSPAVQQNSSLVPSINTDEPTGAVIVRRPSNETLDEHDGTWIDDATLQRSGVRIVPVAPVPETVEPSGSDATSAPNPLSPMQTPSALATPPSTPPTKAKNVRFMQVLDDMTKEAQLLQQQQPRAYQQLQSAALKPGVGPLEVDDSPIGNFPRVQNFLRGRAKSPSNPLLYYPARTASLQYAPEELHEIPEFAPPPTLVRGVVKGILKRHPGDMEGTRLVPPARKGSMEYPPPTHMLEAMGVERGHRRSLTAPVSIEYSFDLATSHPPPPPPTHPIAPPRNVSSPTELRAPPLSTINEQDPDSSMDDMSHLADLANPPPTTKSRTRNRNSRDKESRKRDSAQKKKRESMPVIQWHEGDGSHIQGGESEDGGEFGTGETVAAWRDTLGRVAKRHSGYQQI
ncbi:hypothetical protein HDV00_011481 [Rhizophlyctis rosea]|nr:hypothetical protein HDV00_011481 [Rhizophlyctis rosea]